ncbi:MAG: ATP phosphoribosyltransferase [Bacteroidales bacterium]|nr:ATP phosphoribosyltransferase [Bacteroidales bacterium]
MNTLKIAIQKSGRLSEHSVTMLKEAGMHLTNGKRTLLAYSSSFPLEILYLRDDDIPQYVGDQVADAGIIGEDVLVESGNNLEIIQRLGFSRCRLSLAIPKEINYDDLGWFSGKRVATSFPNILRNYLERHNLHAEIHELNGSVEIAPAIGLADGILDIVSSGSTLISNGLKEVEVVMQSEAVLVSSPKLSHIKQVLLEDFLFRIRAVLAARDNKYILLNAPNDRINEICRILPGMKGPTVMPLAEPGWSSIHSVLSESQFWSVINQLREVGAEGILVIPIEKMIV